MRVTPSPHTPAHIHVMGEVWTCEGECLPISTFGTEEWRRKRKSIKFLNKIAAEDLANCCCFVLILENVPAATSLSDLSIKLQQRIYLPIDCCFVLTLENVPAATSLSDLSIKLPQRIYLPCGCCFVLTLENVPAATSLSDLSIKLPQRILLVAAVLFSRLRMYLLP